jgi:hypothetical protein
MRSGGKQAMLVALAALVTSLWSEPASAQVVVTSEHDLTFGQVTPGVPAQVAPTDPSRRARLTVTGRGRYWLGFLLPANLTGPSGRQIPLTFNATDGRVQVNTTTTTFNPQFGQTVQLTNTNRTAEVYLGGRATPPTGTPAGTYTATIVMWIIQIGT